MKIYLFKFSRWNPVDKSAQESYNCLKDFEAWIKTVAVLAGPNGFKN